MALPSADKGVRTGHAPDHPEAGDSCVSKSPQRPLDALPDARDLLPEAVRACRDGHLVLLFDYDGTLTPIVPHPDQALLPPAVRQALSRLRRRVPVAVISGRDLSDVRTRVGLDEIWYAGSHGFEIQGPAGERLDLGSDFTAELERATAALRQVAEAFRGAWVERKRYAVALHWRAVPDPHEDALAARLRELLERHPQLELRSGKRVFELRPASGWHKGKAAQWLLDRLEVRDRLVLFFGDDVTDEDAFEELAGEARSIVIGEGQRPTAACWRLPDTAAVGEFLAVLATECGDRDADTPHTNDRSAL